MSWSIRDVPAHLAAEVAETLLRLGRSEDAGRIWRALHEVLNDQAAADPANTQWQRDLSVSQNKLGDLHVARGEGDAALARYREGLAIRERLAAADPANTQWQRDLVVSMVKLAEFGDDPVERYARALSIVERLKDERRLQQSDAWMISDLEKRLHESRRG